MSYILDALTKAAQQRDRQVPVVQRLLSAAPRTRSPWSYASVRVLAAVAVSAVLLSGLLIWWLRPVPTEAPSEPIAAPAPAQAPVPLPGPASPPAGASSQASARPLVKLEPLPKPVPAVERPSSPPSDVRAGAPASMKPSAPPPAVTPPPRMGTPTLEPAPAAPPAPSPPAVPPASAARPAGPLEPTNLRVEALIYAETPAERMVFINGRRYREGESIDGRLRIEEIREDGVELSDQGRRFTLRVSR